MSFKFHLQLPVTKDLVLLGITMMYKTSRSVGICENWRNKMEFKTQNKIIITKKPQHG